MPERERRSKRRYPLQLNLRYRSISDRMPMAGTGRTLNVSSRGILIASEQEVQEGTRLHVRVEWPWLLDSATPLQLVAESRVVRASRAEFAVELLRYQFRTFRRHGVPVDPLVWATAPITA
jgi:PilZ domain